MTRRAVDHSPYLRPHHYTLYELTPDYRSPDGSKRHNSYGFRGPEFEVRKPQGTCRVVCMGDSAVYSSRIDEDELTYPARLEHHLRLAFPERTIEVLNAGVPGYTSAEDLLSFIFKVQPLAPDLIVFYHTHTDVFPRRWPTLSRDYGEYRKVWRDSWLRHTSLWRRIAGPFRPERRLGHLVTRAREKLGRITYENLRTNPPDHFAANLRSLAILCQGWGIPLLFVNPPYPHVDDGIDPSRLPLPALGVHEHRRVIEEIGAELGVPVYDLRSDMPRAPRDAAELGASRVYQDSVHVTPEGADMMARAICRTIVRLGLIRVEDGSTRAGVDPATALVASSG